MAYSDSDSDEEYPRRWTDRLEFFTDGELLKIDCKIGFYFREEDIGLMLFVILM